jgi:hypothetical protein
LRFPFDRKVSAGYNNCVTEKQLMESGPLVRLRLLPSRTLFRVGPAWAVIAGVVAAGLPDLGVTALLAVVTAAALADLVWGALRQIVPGPERRSSIDDGAAPVSLALPYLQPDSPLAGWLRSLTPAASGEHESRGWQGTLIALAVAFALSVLLGVPAVMLSGVAVFVIMIAAAVARRGDIPAFWNALLDVGLPWALGLSLAWNGNGAPAAFAPAAALGGAFTVLQWGIYRAEETPGMFDAPRPARRRTGLAWLGQFLVLLVLIVFRQPWAVAGTAALLAPPSFWLARAGSGVSSALPWWWAAMLLSALSLYQIAPV